MLTGLSGPSAPRQRPWLAQARLAQGWLAFTRTRSGITAHYAEMVAERDQDPTFVQIARSQYLSSKKCAADLAQNNVKAIKLSTQSSYKKVKRVRLSAQTKNALNEPQHVKSDPKGDKKE